MPIDTRTSRLQHRFDLIHSAMVVSVGPELAFAAKMAAWGMVMEQIIHEMMKEIADHPERLELFRKESQILLQSWHSSLCGYLNLDDSQVLDLVDNFQQVMRDILEKRG